ncbi:MAG TPA: hypothetical protein VNJ07_08810 [Chitinophagales bacterium]|nr:hypothetical protein [Chitinophagales bacterium]
MKKVKFLLSGGLLLSLAAFQSCNCDEAVKKEQSACESKLTAVKDSLQGAAKTELDAVTANYQQQIQALNDSLAALTAKLEAKTSKTAAPKKPTTTAAPKKEEPKTKTETILEQKKAKMKGGQ